MYRTNLEQLDSLDLNINVRTSLSRHLERIVKGDETVLTSPIVQSHSPDFLLSEWDKVFFSSKNFISKDLHRLEASNRSKFGPRSIAIPWDERRGSVLDYFSGEKSRLNGNFESLEPFCRLASHRLRPLSLDSASQFLKNNTNSGLPFFTRKGAVKDNFSKNLQALLNLQTREDPCVMFTRTQESMKTRTVWGYPIADTLSEMRYYRPLLNYQKKLTWRSALSGPDSTNRKITDIILKAKYYNQTLASIDFSNYDATVKPKLQKASFDYIDSLFQPQYFDELKFIAYRFSTIGLITPDGIMQGEHGVPSGSTFTNEVDSISQYLIAKSNKLQEDQFDIQGDDGAYRISDPDSLKEAFRSFGLNVNDEKSFIRSGSLVYLQNLYDIEHIKNKLISGIYPTYRALNRIIYLERYNDFQKDEIAGRDYFSIRTIAILENCKHHPLFKEFVGFVAKYDKYKLSFSENGLNNYVKRVVQSKGSEGIILNQYEDYVTGLRNFETVKIISELNLG